MAPATNTGDDGHSSRCSSPAPRCHTEDDTLLRELLVTPAQGKVQAGSCVKGRFEVNFFHLS